MQTLTRETHTSDRAGPSRRWLLPVIAVLVLLVIAGGVWAILEATRTDDQAVATELVDTWIRGLNEQDADAIRSVFTDDAVIDLRGAPLTVEQHVSQSMSSGSGTNLTRMGELTPTREEGLFTVGVEFDWGGSRWYGEVEVELEGDLIARGELIGDYTAVDS
jgi:hypothetical protein